MAGNGYPLRWPYNKGSTVGQRHHLSSQLHHSGDPSPEQASVTSKHACRCSSWQSMTAVSGSQLSVQARAS